MARRVERDWIALTRDLTVALAVAGAVFALSYSNGGFDVTTRAYAGISAWWLLGVGAALGLGAVHSRASSFAFCALGLLAAFAIWTLISVGWAPDTERAFAQFDQVSLYVAVLAVAIVLGRVVSGSVVVSGVALAISGVAVVSLVSRLFPSAFGIAYSPILTSINNRLSFPLGYWNGLGIDAALAYPLLLSLMTSRRSRIVSALAALPLPVLGADMYLTSSRGAFVAAAVGLIAYLALTPRRWPAVAAVALAAAAAAVSVATIQPRHALVDADGSALAVQQGHHVALVVGIACVVCALVWFGLVLLGRHVPAPPRVAGQVLTGLVVAAVIAAVVLSHPVMRFHDFKGTATYGGANMTFIEQHLLSSSGSGRWQFWGGAIGQFRAHPLVGGGAGSWLYYWLQHQTSIFSQYAHSLYLEALAELGIIGFLLILGAVLVGLVGAARSALRLASGEIAAAAAAAIAFFVAAAYDWVWQLAGIAVVGVGLMGVALGALPTSRLGTWGREGLVRPALALVAVAAIVPQVIVLAANLHLDSSQAAVNANNATRATSQALAAKAVEPWAASPYLQLAQIASAQGRFHAAHRWLDEAIDRSSLDSNLWVVAAGIDTNLGHIGQARHDLAVARRLWPNNQLLQLPNSGG